MKTDTDQMTDKSQRALDAGNTATFKITKSGNHVFLQTPQNASDPSFIAFLRSNLKRRPIPETLKENILQQIRSSEP
ncbi:MAG: hypothetical protein ACFCUI_04870 [Bernardetiaceae bacterium]